MPFKTNAAKGATGLVGAAAVAFGLYVGFLEQKEATRYKAYQDSLGIWTICTGDTSDVRAGMIETKEGCRRRLEEDARQAWEDADRLVDTKMTWGQHRAYADYVFNAGAGNFAVSAMRTYANQGKVQESCDAFLGHMKAGGRDCRDRKNNCYGIVIRRNEERKICLSGDAL